MSQLTEALNRIMNWLEEHQPEYAASFLPGLSRQEIDEVIASSLNLCIPEEIYELYQWRNGRSVEPIIDTDIPTFEIYNFLPLKEALEPDLIDIINLSPFDGGFLTEKYKGKTLFPFLGYLDPVTYAVVVSDKQEKSYPVVSLGNEDEEPCAYYTSITSMISMCAEAYETGAYYIGNEGWICVEHSKLTEILHKYDVWY